MQWSCQYQVGRLHSALTLANTIEMALVNKRHYSTSSSLFLCINRDKMNLQLSAEIAAHLRNLENYFTVTKIITLNFAKSIRNGNYT